MPPITKRTVDGATPGPKDAFLWDETLKGFGLKITPTGAKVYLAQYRAGKGRGAPTKRVTIGRHGAPWTPDQARDRAKAILGKVANGGDPAAERRAEREARTQRQPDQRSLETVSRRWFSDQRRDGKRSADEVERSFIRHVYPELGARAIEGIAKADGHRLYDRLADAGHAPMGHQLVRNLKALLSFAVERDLIPVNALLRIKLPKLVSRDRVLIKFHPEREPDPTELLAAWNAADQLVQPRRTFVKVLMLTLARADEVAGMKWGEIDSGLWRIPPERHKGKRGHDVPMPAQALEPLEALPRVSDHVFYTGRGEHLGDFSGVKMDLDALILKSAREIDPGAKPFPAWRWHDLRRSGSSWIEEEFGREVMHACLGHGMGNRLAETYCRGAGYRRKRGALQEWADYVSGATRSKVVDLMAAR
jgi:integrase